MALDREDLLAAALEYAALGYAVFPCVPGAKHPITQRGFKDATTNTAQIESWWREWPSANIATPTQGLLVIDQEGPSPCWPVGSESKRLDLAKAPTAVTPSGGVHSYFKQPPDKSWPSSVKKLGDNVDTRANGGYVLLPPSSVVDKPYQWQPTLELDVRPEHLPLPPAWLITQLDSLCETKSAPSSSNANTIPEGQRNTTLASLAGTMRRVGMSEPEILAALTQANADRCKPPLPEREVAKIAQSVARYEPDPVSVAVAEDHFAQDLHAASAPFASAREVCESHQALRKPVIHGLLREGETMNVIAAPKTGKSWLVHNLGLSVVTGMPWLGFPTEPGRVLLIDNELHEETLANRLPRVAGAMELPERLWMDGLFVRSLRGKLEDLFRMEAYFQSLPKDFFKLIILDAFYRFLPRNVDENDNGTMANLYNLLDRCATKLNTGFVLIHHTSKGIQSGKSVTDVGAGAGSQSRAADCHFILRPHEVDGCLSVDAVARSWPPPGAFVIRQDFPLWHPDPTLDPRDLKRPDDFTRKRTADVEASGEVSNAPDEIEWTIETFVAEFISEVPRTKAMIQASANDKDISDYAAAKFVEKAHARGLIHRWAMDHGRSGYATSPQPSLLPGEKEKAK